MRKLHSHAMVIGSNAQTTNNSTGIIRPAIVRWPWPIHSVIGWKWK